MIPRLLLFIVGLCMGYPSLVWADDAAPLHRHEEAVQGQGRLQEALQRSYERSPIFRLEEAERDKIVRFRLKPDVKRGNRKAVRLEMSGPEGFMIGFDQYK
ncbi:MAG: hypothetical protein KIT22_20000 [Verrucomicrobiae bacterium]|nr:hypothetical protein [Verrucomicrobiae bacterium]